MQYRNLAIVFGPTLVHPADNNVNSLLTDMSDQCRIVESIIAHCHWFFSDEVESQQDVPIDAQPAGEEIPNALLATSTEKKEDEGERRREKNL